MNELSSRLRSLQEEYARRLPEKIEQLDELWQKLLYVDWRTDLFALLQRMVHNLAGSGRSFGFGELGDTAAELDRFLQQCLAEGKPPSDSVRQRISAALQDMRRQIVPQPSAPAPQGGNGVEAAPRPLIFVVDDDRDLSTYLDLQLGLHGYQTRVFDSVAAAIDAMSALRPAAVLMDVMFPRSYRAGIDAVAELRTRVASRVPVVFMSARTDMTARLEALRAGGDAYFTKPLDMDALCQKLGELIRPSSESAHRVLVVEHDAERADAYCEALESVGMLCRRLHNGLQLVEEIMQFRPDLILLARRSGAWDGLELACAIRQDEQFAFTPIVFTVEGDDAQLREQALRHGIDDLVAADTPAVELAACVHERIHSAARVSSRARMLSARDPLTGTLSRRSFLERADLELSASPGAQGRPGMVYLTVDDVAALRRRLGPACFRAVIAQLANRVQDAVSAEQAVAYFGNGIFTVLVHAAQNEALVDLAAAIVKRMVSSPVHACGQSAAVHCSAGVALQEAEVTDASSLLARAEQAAADAQQRSDCAVCAYGVPAPLETAPVAGDAGPKVERALQTRAFQLVYQPILRLHGEHEETYEALLRMTDEDRRPIAPAVFMPYLRHENRMLEVDRWVIEHAIETLAADRRTRGRTRFFIKLSRQALANRMLPVWISNCIRNSRLIGQDRIVFEANEADVAECLEQTASLVLGLRQLHCAFAVEYFGSSEVTASVLEKIRPEYIKLQGDAIRGMVADSAVAQRIGTLIAQAKAAGSDVIVGHVEDTQTLGLLWDMGVRYFQGYAVRSPAESLDFDFQTALGLAPAGQ